MFSEKLGAIITLEVVHRDGDGNIINQQRHVFDEKEERIKKLTMNLQKLNETLKALRKQRGEKIDG